jgi:hypothetical protein
MTRGRGIGFFEAGNFYPDFIMWQIPMAGATDAAQRITFIDPKGIARLDGEEDPKIRFHTTIKDVQDRLNEKAQDAAGAILNSFVVSNTPYSTLGSNWGQKSALESQHLLFQEDEDYIERMFDLISRDSG